jgi:D-sedoheptulose 7-phosphate isomerase
LASGAGVVTAKVRTALPAIRAIALDVDGVLTDDTFLWGPNGEEWKRFAFLDVMGVSRARKAGFHFALISGEASPLVDRYAEKMSIAHVFKGIKDKAAALREFAGRLGLETSAVAFVGNDVNDLGAIELSGLTGCPVDAHPSVLARVDYVATKPAGRGAVREVLDLIMERDAPKPAVVERDMSAFFKQEFEEHQRVMQQLVDEQSTLMQQLVDVFISAFERGNKVLFCGNGGSAADSQHIAAEFINRFRFDRDPLPAIALTVDSSILTCIGNDASFDEVFEKQVRALAQPGDLLVGISTSGKSKNVLKALEAARARRAITMAFTGADGLERMAPYSDHVLAVPSRDTARIQEAHEFAFHCIAALVEDAMFKAKP